LNNKTIYSGRELKLWKDRDVILAQEKYLLEKYIKKRDAKIIEAGTGGGRLSLYLYDNGFKNIFAFDFVSEMINSAKAKNNKIDFVEADATDLSIIEDARFDYAIYLQQIISFVLIEKIDKALSESYRILKPNGVVLFSFLNYNGRKINPYLSNILNIVSFLRGEKRDRHALPWLKIGNKPNYYLFKKNQALTYWFYESDIIKRLEKIGFNIVETKKSKDFVGGKAEGMLYIVCKK
jgi:ubiquinone/menaquinone biosynthesis C-methylase UbiE